MRLVETHNLPGQKHIHLTIIFEEITFRLRVLISMGGSLMDGDGGSEPQGCGAFAPDVMFNVHGSTPEQSQPIPAFTYSLVKVAKVVYWAIWLYSSHVSRVCIL